jgi:hypothetical protein
MPDGQRIPDAPDQILLVSEMEGKIRCGEVKKAHYV